MRVSLDQSRDIEDDFLFTQVGPSTNENATQCLAEHLTSFASSFAYLPPAIDWNRAFAHADFLSNPTIYLTVIVVLLFYTVLMIYSRLFDRRDRQRVRLPLRTRYLSSSIGIL